MVLEEAKQMVAERQTDIKTVILTFHILLFLVPLTKCPLVDCGEMLYSTWEPHITMQWQIVMFGHKANKSSALNGFGIYTHHMNTDVDQF